MSTINALKYPVAHSSQTKIKKKKLTIETNFTNPNDDYSSTPGYSMNEDDSSFSASELQRKYRKQRSTKNNYIPSPSLFVNKQFSVSNSSNLLTPVEEEDISPSSPQITSPLKRSYNKQFESSNNNNINNNNNNNNTINDFTYEPSLYELKKNQGIEYIEMDSSVDYSVLLNRLLYNKHKYKNNKKKLKKNQGNNDEIVVDQKEFKKLKLSKKKPVLSSSLSLHSDEDNNIEEKENSKDILNNNNNKKKKKNKNWLTRWIQRIKQKYHDYKLKKRMKKQIKYRQSASKEIELSNDNFIKNKKQMKIKSKKIRNKENEEENKEEIVDNRKAIQEKEDSILYNEDEKNLDIPFADESNSVSKQPIKQESIRNVTDPNLLMEHNHYDMNNPNSSSSLPPPSSSSNVTINNNNNNNHNNSLHIIQTSPSTPVSPQSLYMYNNIDNYYAKPYYYVGNNDYLNIKNNNIDSSNKYDIINNQSQNNNILLSPSTAVLTNHNTISQSSSSSSSNVLLHANPDYSNTLSPYIYTSPSDDDYEEIKVINNTNTSSINHNNEIHNDNNNTDNHIDPNSLIKPLSSSLNNPIITNIDSNLNLSFSQENSNKSIILPNSSYINPLLTSNISSENHDSVHESSEINEISPSIVDSNVSTYNSSSSSLIDSNLSSSTTTTISSLLLNKNISSSNPFQTNKNNSSSSSSLPNNISIDNHLPLEYDNISLFTFKKRPILKTKSERYNLCKLGETNCVPLEPISESNDLKGNKNIKEDNNNNLNHYSTDINQNKDLKVISTNDEYILKQEENEIKEKEQFYNKKQYISLMGLDIDSILYEDDEYIENEKEYKKQSLDKTYENESINNEIYIEDIHKNSITNKKNKNSLLKSQDTHKYMNNNTVNDYVIVPSPKPNSIPIEYSKNHEDMKLNRDHNNKYIHIEIGDDKEMNNNNNNQVYFNHNHNESLLDDSNEKYSLDNLSKDKNNHGNTINNDSISNIQIKENSSNIYTQNNKQICNNKEEQSQIENNHDYLYKNNGVEGGRGIQNILLEEGKKEAQNDQINKNIIKEEEDKELQKAFDIINMTSKRKTFENTENILSAEGAIQYFNPEFDLIQKRTFYMPLSVIIRSRYLEAIDACVVDNCKSITLILDRPSMYGLTCVLTKSDLRKKNVHVLQMLESPNRRVYPEKTAIYFINPVYYENGISSYHRFKDDLKQMKKGYMHIFVYITLSPSSQERKQWFSSTLLKNIYTPPIVFGGDFTTINDDIILLNNMEDIEGPLLDRTSKFHEKAISLLIKKLISVIISLNEYPYLRFDPCFPITGHLTGKFYFELNNHVRKDADFWYHGARKIEYRSTFLSISRKGDLLSIFTHDNSYESLINNFLYVSPNGRISTYKESIYTYLCGGIDEQSSINPHSDLWCTIRDKTIEDAEIELRDSLVACEQTMNVATSRSSTVRSLYSTSRKLENALLIREHADNHLFIVNSLRRIVEVNEKMELFLSAISMSDDEKMKLLALYILCYKITIFHDETYSKYLSRCNFKNEQYIKALDNLIRYNRSIMPHSRQSYDNSIQMTNSLSSILQQLQCGYLDHNLFPFLITPPSDYPIPLSPLKKQGLIGEKQSKLFIVLLGGLTFKELKLIRKIKKNLSIDIVIITTSLIRNNNITDFLLHLTN
ncbi:hypothetical protein WA158_008225 [Blastocystis sp. Blastoise]